MNLQDRIVARTVAWCQENKSANLMQAWAKMPAHLQAEFEDQQDFMERVNERLAIMEAK